MKSLLVIFLFFAVGINLFAGESSLTKTFQPLDGMASGKIEIAPVMCHDWYAFSGFPTAIGLITAKNVPPTNAPKPIEDINVASACNLSFTVNEDATGRLVVTLDCRNLKVPQRFGCTELQAVGATLESLRLVAGAKLDLMKIEIQLKPKGQEEIQKLVAAFIKHPKDKAFLWK